MSPHGTSSRYTNGRCRCADCRAAWAARMRIYQRERRAKHRAEHPRKPPPRKVPEAAHPAIVEQVRAGRTLAAVAADYGISRTRVQQIVAAADPSITADRKHALAEIARLRAENSELHALAERLISGELRVVQPQGATP